MSKIETIMDVVKRVQENGSEGPYVLCESGRVAVVTEVYVLVPMDGDLV